MRDPVTTQSFRLLTPAARPEVWACLTCPVRSPRFLHGLALTACWTPGSPVVLQAPGWPPLGGQVLHVEPGRRLSLTVEDRDSGTCTYLTWGLRDTGTGTVIRLDIDECADRMATADDLEDIWLPVLARLGQVLQTT